MSLETPQDTMPTAGTEPSEPQTPTGDTTAQTLEPAAPAAPQKTYTQADVDRAYAEARRWRQQEESRLREQYARPQQDQTPDDPYRAELAQIKREQEVFRLERTVSEMRSDAKRYPGFAQNEQAVLDLAVQIAEDRPGIKHERVLELAYKAWRHDNEFASLDIEKVRKEAAEKAVADYVAGKTKKADATPRSEGSGGSAPATTRAIKNRKDFDDAIDEVLARTET